MRSRKVSPGFAVIRTTSQSESTRVPPVTALRSPPLSRITGALSPVMALSSTEATPSVISPSAGMSSPASTKHDVALAQLRTTTRHELARRSAVGRASAARGEPRALRGDVLARLAQRVGLRLAAALGHRLGEVGEEHGEPEPERDREDEPGGGVPGAGDQGVDEEEGGERAADLDDEHHRVAHHAARVELAERVDDRPRTIAPSKSGRWVGGRGSALGGIMGRS